jgi:sulfate transport system permease protein
MLLVSFAIVATVNLVQHLSASTGGRHETRDLRSLAGAVFFYRDPGAFILVFLLFPVCVVIYEALRGGLALYFSALTATHSLTAIRLTLLVAVAVVPMNTIFGVCAAWAVTHFRFPGKALLISLIEIPLWVSPVIGGLVFALIFGRQGWLGPWLDSHGIQIILPIPGSCWPPLSSPFPLSRAG